MKRPLGCFTNERRALSIKIILSAVLAKSLYRSATLEELELPTGKPPQ